MSDAGDAKKLRVELDELDRRMAQLRAAQEALRQAWSIRLTRPWLSWVVPGWTDGFLTGNETRFGILGIYGDVGDFLTFDH